MANSFLGLDDSNYSQTTAQQPGFTQDFQWLDAGLDTTFAQADSAQKDGASIWLEFVGRSIQTGSLVQDGSRHDLGQSSLSSQEPVQQHHPQCQAEQSVCNCTQLRRQARLESLTEDMRRFTQQHGGYQPGQ